MAYLGDRTDPLSQVEHYATLDRVVGSLTVIRE